MRVSGFSVVVGAVLFYTCSIHGQVQDDTKGNEECICVPYFMCTNNTTPSSNSGGDNTAPSSNPGGDNTAPSSNTGSDNTPPSSNPGGDNTAPSSNPGSDNTPPSSNPGGDNIPPSSKPGGDGVGADVNTDGTNLIDIRMGEAGCMHYLDKCCVFPGGLPTGPPPTPPPIPQRNSCGVRNTNGVDFKITGNSDNEADYGEFPWMVALLRQDHVGSAPSGGSVDLNVYKCGGSIIHHQVILTAAHCVRKNKDLKVRAGEWDTQTDKERYPIQERNVKQVIIHEDFYAGGLHNDIALLVLESPLEPSPVVSPICLPDQDENMDNRNCVVTGWGKDVFGKEGKYQVILKRVELPVVPRDSCQKALRETRLGKGFILDKSFICAGGEAGKDSCKGDGGGPLACPSKDNPEVYTQAGMVAWGIGCGDPIPAAYVNVPLFRKWIDDKLDALNFS